MNDLVECMPDDRLATVLNVSPKTLMAYAKEVSSTLTSVLREQKMTQFFGENEHVKTEGWQLAGSLMGFVAAEGDARELADGSWEAHMGLKSLKTGEMLPYASALCGIDESNWRNKPKYARRSMAYTRALGRVYAQNFRWLIKLAGFEGTPAEEMPFEMASEPTREKLYDHKSDEMRRALVEILKANKIPQEDWRKVREAFDGKPLSTIGDIVNRYWEESGASP